MERVQELAKALEGSEVNELDLTEGGVRIAIKRQLEEPAPVALPAYIPAPSAAPAPAISRASRPTKHSKGASANNATASAPVESQGVAIASPLTGVFYLTPSPSSPPFVQVGEPVQAGQVVCMVEAMKVFNEIKAEISGVVSAIVAENGQLVQKGEALIRVKLT